MAFIKPALAVLVVGALLGSSPTSNSSSPAAPRHLDGTVVAEHWSATQHVQVVSVVDRYLYHIIQEDLGPGGSVIRTVSMIGDHLMARITGTEHAVPAMLARHGFTLREKLYTPELYLIEIPIADVINRVNNGLPALAPAIAALALEPTVRYSEPDYLLEPAVAPDDPSYASMWNLAKINAPAAWDVTTGSDAVTAAVIDTGVDYTHPDLEDNIWSNPGETAGDGIDNDANGRIDDINGWDFGIGDNDPMDSNGHGTHCAGTIGATGNNGVGIVGICWNVKIMCMKISTTGATLLTSAAVQSVTYATANGAKVTSNSWGGGGYSTSLYNAIAAARDADVLFVAAAGNSGTNNDATPFYPSGYNLTNIIAVLATNSSDARSSFSQYGQTSVDIGAPGEAIQSTTPANTYASWAGTSMACPHVAGAVALACSQFPTETRAWIKSRIMNTSFLLAGLTTRCVSGGRLDLAAMINGVPPAVTITATAPQVNQPVAIAGTATDRDGVVSTVTWANLTNGSSGSATLALPAWDAVIPMDAGLNTIEVTATDDEGHTATAQSTVSFAPPFTFDAPSLSLSAQLNSATPATGTITMTNASGAPLDWTATYDAPWLTMTPASGTGLAVAGAQPLAFSASVTGLAVGTYEVDVLMAAGIAEQVIHVTLTVTPPPSRGHKKRCGSVGVDLMLPLGILWLARRWRRRN